jgi:polyisoprenyl-phosphate glycosyltransferase
MSPKRKLKVDLVIPIFNEAGIVERTHKNVSEAIRSLAYDFQFIYIDDGSTDGTTDALRKLADGDPRIRVLQLSRNFGHQAALTAGMDAARGDVIITMDGDGQHPPEMIAQMIDLIERGYDVVQTQRMDEGRSISFKRITSDVFYRLINIISGTQILQGAADFRALSRDALDGLRSMHEYHRFLRGMVSWMGYRAVILPYHEPSRIAGKSKYSLGKMVRLASDAVFSFSLAPLYIGLSAGLGFFVLAITQLIYVLTLWISGHTERIVAGWSSLMAILLISSGIIMILLGFIGVYVGYIFQEVKRRPVYLVKKDGEPKNGK